MFYMESAKLTGVSVSEQTRKRLKRLLINEGFKTYDRLIRELLKTYKNEKRNS